MIKTKRNYWIPVIGVLNILILLFIQQKTVDISQMDLINFGYSYDPYGSSDMDLNNSYEAILSRNAKTESYLYTYLFSLFVSYVAIIFVSNKIIGHNKNEKSYLIIWSLSYPIYVISALLYDSFYSIFVEKLNFHIILYLLIIPYVYLIAKYSIIGVKMDLTNSIKENNNKGLNDNLTNLNHLKDAKILSDIEYQEKKKALLVDRYKKDFLLSPEYKKLTELKLAGVISQEEIDKKISELVEFKINNSSD